MNNVVIAIALSILTTIGILSINVDTNSEKTLKTAHKKTRLSKDQCHMNDIDCHRHHIRVLKELNAKITKLKKTKKI